MTNWNKLVVVTCPDCGKQREAEDRGRGSIRRCQGCGVSQARSKQVWATTGELHLESRTPLYAVWSAMLERCRNPNSESYARYGGRGITVCAAWGQYTTFRDWAISHGYIKGLYIDRENNDGHYEPENCRWVTSKVSAANRSTSTKAA